MKTGYGKLALGYFSKSRNILIISLILVVLPVMVYWQTTSFDFVWDDEMANLTENPYLNEPSYESLLHLWTTPYLGLYIPVSYTIWGLLRPVGQLFSAEGESFDPFVYHLANIVLHVLNGLLVFGFLNLIVRNEWAALGGALLFLLHPIQVEAVAWVSEFRGLLSACFGLSALHLYFISGRKETSSQGGFIYYYIGSLVLFVFAMLSKPSAAVIPLFACLLDIFLFKRSIKQTAIRIFPWLFLSLPIILVTKAIQSGNMEVVVKNIPVWVRPLIWMDAINFYLYKLVFPISLANCYDRTPEAAMGQWWLYVEWLIPVGLACVLWRVRKSFPVLGVSFLIFLVGLLPVSGLIIFLFQQWSTVADRFIYLSMTGAALAFAYGLSKIRYRMLWVGAGALIVFWGGWSYAKQVPVWTNSLTLWNHCIRITPDEAWGYFNRGNEFQRMREYGKAIGDYGKAIEIHPRFADAYYNRGNAFKNLKKYHRAIEDYTNAIEINPRFMKSYFGRGNVFKNLGEYDKAMADYDMAVEFYPRYAEAYNNRGNLLRDLKDYGRAMRDYEKAIEINPKLSAAYTNRGIVFVHLKKYSEAIKDFNKAIEINPVDAEAYNNRGAAFFLIKNYDRAIRDYNKAIEINPHYAEAHRNREKLLNVLKEYEDTIREYSKAIEMNPHDAEAYNRRGVIYALLKDYNRAVSDYDKAIEIDPGYAEAYNNRAITYYYLKDYARSWNDCQQAQRLGANVHPKVLQAIQRALNAKKDRG